MKYLSFTHYTPVDSSNQLLLLSTSLLYFYSPPSAPLELEHYSTNATIGTKRWNAHMYCSTIFTFTYTTF